MKITYQEVLADGERVLHEREVDHVTVKTGRDGSEIKVVANEAFDREETRVHLNGNISRVFVGLLSSAKVAGYIIRSDGSIDLK